MLPTFEFHGFDLHRTTSSAIGIGMVGVGVATAQPCRICIAIHRITTCAVVLGADWRLDVSALVDTLCWRNTADSGHHMALV
jgi:hypothetical protein